jgi:hypothetical protein
MGLRMNVGSDWSVKSVITRTNETNRLLKTHDMLMPKWAMKAIVM